MAQTQAPSAPVGISESAARRVGQLKAREQNEALKLRLSVSGGGCSGFQYGFSFDEEVKPDDVVVEDKGVTLLVDNMSLLYVTGSIVDFVEDLAGASFQVKNPNAASSCGCGSSFAV